MLSYFLTSESTVSKSQTSKEGSGSDFLKRFGYRLSQVSSPGQQLNKKQHQEPSTTKFANGKKEEKKNVQLWRRTFLGWLGSKFYGITSKA